MWLIIYLFIKKKMKSDEIRANEGLCLRLKRFFFVKCKDTNLLKGISTICGASLLNLIAGSIFSVCQLMIYEISYIYHANPENDISSDNETFYYPVELLSQTIATFFSAILDKKFGLHYTNLIGMVVLIIGYFILLFSKSFAADIVSMIFSGVGTGIIGYVGGVDFPPPQAERHIPIIKRQIHISGIFIILPIFLSSLLL